MRKELPKIIIIFLITIGLVLWGLNFIFLGKAPKSKATGETISFVFDPALVNQASGDFVTSVKVKPSVDMTIRGYQFEINFDKTKIQFKSIQYKTGAVSAGMGDDDSKAAVINQNGKIKVVGEIQSATGLPILTSQNTEMVAITFTANSALSSSITTGAADAKFFMIKTDYSLFDVPSAGQASFSVNGGGPTLTPTPTCSPLPAVCLQLYPTVCPTQAPTGGWCAPSGGVILNLKLKFQGILKKPGDPFNALVVKVFPISSSGIKSCGQAQFSANENGVWSATVSSWDTTTEGCLTPQPGNNFKILVKGPYHIQKKICDAGPTETAGGTYRCAKGNITLVAGNNNLDLSGIVLLAGDLPDQDGSITAYDTSLIYNNLGKTDNDKCDVNRDGKCDTQDYSLVIASLSIKNDEL